MIDFAREIALKSLYKIDTENGYSNLVLDEYLNKYRSKLKNKDISLISEIVYGTVSYKLTIDTIIQKYSKIKLKKLSNWVLNILRIGVYQIVFLDKIPQSAAVNESVNIAKKYAYKSSSFINAILRKVQKNDYEELKKISDDKERISKVYSMPLWIVEELLNEYSKEVTEEICKYLNTRPKTTIRINYLKINKESFIEELDKRNIKYEETEFSNFLHLKNVKNIGELDIFQEGLCTIQDVGAGKITVMLSPQKNDYVLDACSAPGGKTTRSSRNYAKYR